MVRRKRTTLVVCLLLFVISAAPPLTLLGILAACGAATAPEFPEGSAICQYAQRLGLGQGALVPGLAVVVIAVAAVLVGLWCARNVWGVYPRGQPRVHGECDQRYLLGANSA